MAGIPSSPACADGSNERFVLVESFKLGDVLVSGTVARALERRLPGARIVALTAPGGGALPVWQNSSVEVEEVALPWQQLGWGRNPGAVLGALAAVRGRFGRRFAGWTGLDPRGDLRHRAVLRVLGVHTVIHHRSALSATDRWRGALDRHVLEARGDYLAQLGRRLGVDGLGGPRWPFLPRDERLVEQGLAVFAPEASNPLREWTSARWAALASRLRANGWRVVAAVQHGDAIRTDDQRAFDEVWRGSLAELGRLVARAGVVVAVDSLVGHLASGQGTPVVSLVGPQLPERWRPAGDRVEVVIADGYVCRPCAQTVCVRPESRCMEALSVDCVAAAVERVSGSRAAAPRRSALPTVAAAC